MMTARLSRGSHAEAVQLSIARSLAEMVLGGPAGRKISYHLARLGLHGLGVGLPPVPDKSGELFFLSNFLKLFPCKLAIDVGGNIGEYTNILINLGAAGVIVFEPVPASFARLKQNLGQRSDRVEMRQEA